MLDESEEDRCVFHRERSIQRPLSLCARRDPSGIFFLAPEIQLLYKARSVRVEDRRILIASRRDPDARTWLREALTTVDPRHEWLISSPHLASRQDCAHSKEC
jgi:hypothetical protein